MTLVPDRVLVLLQNLKQQASSVYVYLSSLVFQGHIRVSEQTHYSIQWLFKANAPNSPRSSHKLVPKAQEAHDQVYHNHDLT